MKMKNYYRILGVNKREKSSGIRNAYRRLAKKYHPDKAGSCGTSRFQEINEAYEVLSDPGKREDYNRRLLDDSADGRRWFRPEDRAAAPPHFGGSGFSGGVESFFYELFGGPGIFHRRRRPDAEALDFEVLLSFEESAEGVPIDIEAPVFFICPRCRGNGRNGPFICSGCDGEGIMERFEAFTLKIPPGVGDGSRFNVLLQRVGPYSRYLRLHIRVI